MSLLPVDFLLILLGLFAGAVIVTCAACVLRWCRVQRLRSLHRDFSREYDERR